jgi:hypothetical protein
MGEDNDRWIETGLTASFHRLDLGPPPRDALYHSIRAHRSTKRMSLLAGVPALLTTKAAAAALVVALTAAGGVAVKAAATGNPNPLSWGSVVTTQVHTCKAGLAAPAHGVGLCVSATAQQNGQQHRTAHSPGLPGHPGKGPAHPTGAPSHPSHVGKGQNHPTPAPSPHHG